MTSPVNISGISKLSAVVEHALVFVGDLLPYTVMFSLTLMVSYRFGLGPAGFLSLTYAYVAVVTAVVCGPNLLSLRRRMARTSSPGAVVAASLGLRTAVILAGALLVAGGLILNESQPGMLPLMALLFVGRLLETSVDAPATSVQYLSGARNYFLLRLVVSIVICGVTWIAVLTASDSNLIRIAICYVVGSAFGFLIALTLSRRLLVPVSGLLAEYKDQATEFSKFFVATALFSLASRIHPMIITFFSGHKAAGQFALVQNLFSVLALASTAVAGVFFWSRNRDGVRQTLSQVPWHWLLGGLFGGLFLGLVGGVFLDFLFLRPLGSSFELRATAWLLCLSTPFLLTQAIISNLLVLQGRDTEMLAFSVLNAIASLFLITLLVYAFGLVGAALSVGSAALLSSLAGILMVRRTHE